MSSIPEGYTEIKSIGSGAFGEVLLCRNNKTKEEVAVKKIIFKDENEKIFKNEIGCLKFLKTQRENIQFKLEIEDNQEKKQELIDQQTSLSYLLEFKDSVCSKTEGYIITKFYENCLPLSDHLQKLGRKLTYLELLKYFKQLAMGVNQMHQLQMFHRDLKLENFLYCPVEDKIVIIDFGFAKFEQNDSPDEQRVGTRLFSSPQMILHLPMSSEKNDIWSLGVCFYYMLTYQYPFGNAYSTELDFRQIFEGNQTKGFSQLIFENVPNLFNDEILSFIKDILVSMLSFYEHCRNLQFYKNLPFSQIEDKLKKEKFQTRFPTAEDAQQIKKKCISAKISAVDFIPQCLQQMQLPNPQCQPRTQQQTFSQNNMQQNLQRKDQCFTQVQIINNPQNQQQSVQSKHVTQNQLFSQQPSMADKIQTVSPAFNQPVVNIDHQLKYTNTGVSPQLGTVSYNNYQQTNINQQNNVQFSQNYNQAFLNQFTESNFIKDLVSKGNPSVINPSHYNQTISEAIEYLDQIIDWIETQLLTDSFLNQKIKSILNFLVFYLFKLTHFMCSSVANFSFVKEQSFAEDSLNFLVQKMNYASTQFKSELSPKISMNLLLSHCRKYNSKTNQKAKELANSLANSLSINISFFFTEAQGIKPTDSSLLYDSSTPAPNKFISGFIKYSHSKFQMSNKSQFNQFLLQFYHICKQLDEHLEAYPPQFIQQNPKLQQILQALQYIYDSTQKIFFEVSKDNPTQTICLMSC